MKVQERVTEDQRWRFTNMTCTGTLPCGGRRVAKSINLGYLERFFVSRVEVGRGPSKELERVG